MPQNLPRNVAPTDAKISALVPRAVSGAVLLCYPTFPQWVLVCHCGLLPVTSLWLHGQDPQLCAWRQAPVDARMSCDVLSRGSAQASCSYGRREGA
jgi:hypothetical protein